MDNDPIYPSRLEMHYKGLYNEPISSGHLTLAKSYLLSLTSFCYVGLHGS